MINIHENDFNFTDLSLENRVTNGSVSKKELAQRAKKFFDIIKDDNPIKIDNKIGCPVCNSQLSEGNKLVRENGYIVCDYCVPYVEEYLFG